MADSTTHYGLTKPLGTEYYNISVPNGNMDKIDTALHALGSGLAIIATGDTHAAASSGDFIYIHSHGTLAEGLYKATTSIAQNATLSGSNVTAATGGGLNALASNVNTALGGKVDKVTGKGLSTNDYTTTEKTKLSGIQAGAQVNPGNATTSAAGLMSATDKTKLNGIATEANKVTISADIAEISTGSISAGEVKTIKKEITIPAGTYLLGVLGVLQIYNRFDVRSVMGSTDGVTGKHYISITLKNPSNAGYSDTVYVEYGLFSL